MYQRYLSLDDRIAWGYFEFTDDVLNGETVEEWVPLTGKQGNEKEGNVNIILSLQVPTVYKLVFPACLTFIVNLVL